MSRTAPVVCSESGAERIACRASCGSSSHSCCSSTAPSACALSCLRTAQVASVKGGGTRARLRVSGILKSVLGTELIRRVYVAALACELVRDLGLDGHGAGRPRVSRCTGADVIRSLSLGRQQGSLHAPSARGKCCTNAC
jgi:hypothetical protein